MGRKAHLTAEEVAKTFTKVGSTNRRRKCLFLAGAAKVLLYTRELTGKALASLNRRVRGYPRD